jgi:tRNA pseudouridine38-40 synthase
MYRYKFIIEYDGSKFDIGWQKQSSSTKSVQETLESAGYKLTQREVKFYGASRTDKDVHAMHQVAHVDLHKPYSLKCLHDGMNAYLLDTGCKIVAVSPSNESFHARFGAKTKTYCYIISHSRICSVFDEKRVWWIRKSQKLDYSLIEEASKYLIGEHDFSSFRDSSCQSPTPVKTIESISFEYANDKIIITFKARSFLHKQIRIMVGTLVDIGKGKLSDIQNILNSKKRVEAGQTAPGCGLFLKMIEYDHDE